MSFITPSDIIPVTGFAALPNADKAILGTVYKVSGVGVGGSSFWISDGTYWRPLNGYAHLYSNAGYATGGVGVPIASTVGAAFWVLPESLIIPRGMIIPGSSIMLRVRMVGGAGLYAYFSGTITGTLLMVRQSLSTNNSYNLEGYFDLTAASADATQFIPLGYGVTQPVNWQTNINNFLGAAFSETESRTVRNDLEDIEIKLYALGTSRLYLYDVVFRA